MHIDTVSISNYRNFGSNFSIKLKPFTLLLGENNIGKSNLIAAIGLILGSDISSQRRRMLELEDLNYSAILRLKQDVADSGIDASSITLPEVIISITFIDMKTDEQSSVVGDWFIDKELKQAQLTYKFAPKPGFDKNKWIAEERSRLAGRLLSENIDFPIHKYSYSLYGGNRPTAACDPYLLRALRLDCLDALRDAQRELVASGEYRLLSRILNRHNESSFHDVLEALKSLEAVVQKNEKLKTIKGEVSKTLTDVSLHVDDNEALIDFHFSAPASSEILKRLSLIYGAVPIDVFRNGLGRNNLLYLSLILTHLSDIDASGNPSCFRLIAIEEPEAHLHPHLEDHLASNIEKFQSTSNGKVQLILTSHSTHITAKLDLSSTCVLFRDSSSKEITGHYVAQGFDKADDKQSLEYLRKFLDATKSRMLFARRIIFVEGISEELLLPLMFKQLKKYSLEKAGISIVNVNGVSFRHFLKIVKKGYYLRCAVVTDKDYDEDEAEDEAESGRADKLKTDYDTPDLILIEVSKNDTFEMDLAEYNKAGNCKEALLNALCKTRPRLGPKYRKEIASADIVPQVFFENIGKTHKSRFALNLAEEMKSKQIEIPPYIKSAFEFVTK